MMLRMFKKRLDERGNVPAVMIAAMLLSATALLLTSFSVVNMKNSELLVAKNNMNKALTACSSLLGAEVFRNFAGDPAPVDALMNIASTQCNFQQLGVQVTIEGTPEQFTPAGDTVPQSVEITLRAVYGQNPVQPTKSQSTRSQYLPYANAQTTMLNDFSCITGWDNLGNAIWTENCPTN